jgi:hypothetical protein
LTEDRESASRSSKHLRRLNNDFFGAHGTGPPLGIFRIPVNATPEPGSGAQRSAAPGSPAENPRSLKQGEVLLPPTSPTIKVYPKLTPEVFGLSKRESGPDPGPADKPREQIGLGPQSHLRPAPIPADSRTPPGLSNEPEPVSDPGMRDLWRDGIHRDLYRGLGAQDLVRDRGLQDLLRLGAPLGGGLPTQVVMFASAARSGGWAAGLRRSLSTGSPTPGEIVAIPTPVPARASPPGMQPGNRKRPPRGGKGVERKARSSSASGSGASNRGPSPRSGRRK